MTEQTDVEEAQMAEQERAMLRRLAELTAARSREAE